MEMITREDTPRRYGLSCNLKVPSITVSVHREIIKAASSLPIDQFAEPFIKNFEFKKFEASLEKNFGFEDVLELSESKDGEFIDFTAEVPVVITLGEICNECRNTALRKRCISCAGLGREENYDWDSAYAVSASFNILIDLARYPTIKTTCNLPQLLTVSLFTNFGLGRSALGGTYSRSVVRWLAQKNIYTEIPKVRKAMRTVFEAIIPNKIMKPYPLRAHIFHKHGGLMLECPGDACDLSPSDVSELNEKGGKEGYDIHSHNVDNPAQQLTFLAGLAALHMEVDKSIKAK